MTIARGLRDVLEPVTGQVYFSPECHSGYQALGFGPSPGAANGVALPDGAAYFTSRGSVMGQVAGDVVAAAFGVFNPAVVCPAVAYGWSLTDAPTICQARTDGATAQLVRILGERPAGLEEVTEILRRISDGLAPSGRALFAGVRSQGPPGTPVGDMWWYGDLLREYRGDSHTIAWTALGYDAVEIGLLTELFWGLPMGTYIRTRAWSDAQIADATERLRSRGLLEGDGFSAAGRAAREEVEAATDRQMAPVIAALGDDSDGLCKWLETWSRAIVEAGGYLRGPLGQDTTGSSSADG
jgi:hypothetical protein